VGARYSRLLQVGALILFAVVTAGAQSRFTLSVHTGRGANGYDVNSTMISGEKDMLLIDPQFTLSEAHKLAARIPVEEEPCSDLRHARASGSSFRSRGAEARPSQRKDSGATGDG
jgi:hypothetical protein